MYGVVPVMVIVPLLMDVNLNLENVIVKLSMSKVDVVKNMVNVPLDNVVVNMDGVVQMINTGEPDVNLNLVIVIRNIKN